MYSSHNKESPLFSKQHSTIYKQHHNLLAVHMNKGAHGSISRGRGARERLWVAWARLHRSQLCTADHGSTTRRLRASARCQRADSCMYCTATFCQWLNVSYPACRPFGIFVHVGMKDSIIASRPRCASQSCTRCIITANGDPAAADQKVHHIFCAWQHARRARWMQHEAMPAHAYGPSMCVCSNICLLHMNTCSLMGQDKGCMANNMGEQLTSMAWLLPLVMTTCCPAGGSCSFCVCCLAQSNKGM